PPDAEEHRAERFEGPPLRRRKRVDVGDRGDRVLTQVRREELGRFGERRTKDAKPLDRARAALEDARARDAERGALREGAAVPAQEAARDGVVAGRAGVGGDERADRARLGAGPLVLEARPHGFDAIERIERRAGRVEEEREGRERRVRGALVVRLTPAAKL